MPEGEETEETTTEIDPNEGAKKALAEERRARRAAEKQLHDLETRVKEFEDRDKSDTEKHSARADAAEARATKAERDLARYRVAADKGLDSKLAGRLQGDTDEELAADAETLLKQFGTATKTATTFDGGARTTTTSTGDPGADFNNAFRRLATS